MRCFVFPFYAVSERLVNFFLLSNGLWIWSWVWALIGVRTIGKHRALTYKRVRREFRCCSSWRLFIWFLVRGCNRWLVHFFNYSTQVLICFVRLTKFIFDYVSRLWSHISLCNYLGVIIWIYGAILHLFFLYHSHWL